MTQKLPRGLRNNNPGNIEIREKWQGLSTKQLDSRFCTFSEMVYGCRALIKTLQTYHNKYKLSTIKGIICRWAPPKENNTVAYIASVAKALNVEPLDGITFTRDVYINLAKAIARHENGAVADRLITNETWEKAANLAGL